IFTIPGLLPGQYEVGIEATGFAPRKIRVEVTVGSRVLVDGALSIEGVASQVDVQASESRFQINSTSQEQSTVVNEKQLKELPTITRTLYDFVQLSGNVAGTTDEKDGSTNRGVGVAINGQRASSVNIQLDGSDNNNEFTASVGQSVPIDSVQEFSVITNTFTAEFGRATGGVNNIGYKTREDELHGKNNEIN